MNTDIHNHDEQFRQAYNHLEEEPSADVWSKIAADLDSRDAEHFQQKSIRWKRTSILLLLLLGLVTISSIVYIAGKKTEVQVQNANGPLAGKKVDDNSSETLSAINPTKTITNNTNPTENDAAIEPTASQFKKESFQPGTHKEQLDDHTEQANAEPGKQHPEQVQNTTLEQPLIRSKRDKSVQNNTLAIGKHQQAFTKENNPFRSRTKPVFSTAGTSLSNQGGIQSLVSVNGKDVSEKRGGHSSDAQDIVNENVNAFEVSPTLKTSFNISREQQQPAYLESVDSGVVNHVNSLIASNQKSAPDANTTADNTTTARRIKIASPVKPRLELIGYTSLDFTQYTLDNDEHERTSQPQQHRDDKSEIEERESHGFSFSAGLTARLQLTSKLSLKSGLIYANSSIDIQPQTLYAARDGSQNIAYKFVTSSGYAYVKPVNGATIAVGDSTKTNSSHQDLQYLSIPLTVGYKVYAGKRFSIVPSIGAAANILLGARAETEINTAPARQAIIIDKFNGLQSWYPSLLADATLQYHVKRNFSMTLLPSFRYAFRPITQNNAVKTFPYSLGLGIGCTYHF